MASLEDIEVKKLKEEMLKKMLKQHFSENGDRGISFHKGANMVLQLESQEDEENERKKREMQNLMKYTKDLSE